MKKLLILLMLIPMPLYAVTVTATSTTSTSTSDILGDINIYRAKYNLTPLEVNEDLCTLAKARTEQIKTDWSHGGFQDEVDKLPNMGGVFYENLARNYETEDVVWAWSMSQFGHREAMLVSEMKYGCVIESDKHFAFEGYIPK